MAKPTPEETAAAEAATVAKAAEDAEFAALAAAETAAAEAAVADQSDALQADEDGNVEVKTTGDFMLVDPISGAQIEATGATAVKLTSFIQQRYELGQLKAA